MNENKKILEKENMCKIEDIATYLNISKSEVRKLTNERKIPFFKIESAIRFNPKSINKWVADLEENESKKSLFF